MGLLGLLVRLLAAVVLMLVVASAALIGRDRLRATVRSLGPRLRNAAPYVGVLAVTLGVDKVARDVGPEVSWVIGLNVTGRWAR